VLNNISTATPPSAGRPLFFPLVRKARLRSFAVCASGVAFIFRFEQSEKTGPPASGGDGAVSQKKISDSSGYFLQQAF